MWDRKAGKVSKPFLFNIGLLCSKTFDDAIFPELFEAKYGLAKADMVKMNIKGVFQIWMRDGSYHEIDLKECHQWTRQGCKHCPDFAAEHADISTGGIGEDNDWTLTIVRTELGEEVIGRMIADGTIIARPAQEDDKAMKLLRTLSIVSRRRWPDHRRPRPHHRRPTPQEENRRRGPPDPEPARSGGAQRDVLTRKSMELLFIRHALPLRVEGFEGPADPELSEAGQHQARHLAEYLAFERIHAVFASPLRRAIQTAEPVAAQAVDRGRPSPTGSPSTTGRPRSTSRSSSSRRRVCPGWQDVLTGDAQRTAGVDPHEFRAGVVDAVEAIIAAHPGEKVAAVCHGGVINAYLTHILGIADPSGFFYPNYTSIHRIAAARSGERSVLSLNETCHLRGHRAPGRAVRRVLKRSHRGSRRTVELGRIVQIAYAVDDVRAAARSFAERVGCRPVLRPPPRPAPPRRPPAARPASSTTRRRTGSGARCRSSSSRCTAPRRRAWPTIVAADERHPPRRDVRRVDRRRAASPRRAGLAAGHDRRDGERSALRLPRRPRRARPPARGLRAVAGGASLVRARWPTPPRWDWQIRSEW